jgi:hypothetical protein
MTDYSVDIPKGRLHRRAGPVEYAVYFAPVFVIALPFALLGWLATPLVTGRRADLGPIARARADARAVTAQIFRV